MDTTKSQELFEKYKGIVPGGVHSNFRRPIFFVFPEILREMTNEAIQNLVIKPG